MFANLGLHIHKNPRGTYGFVGSIPTALANIVPATTSDVMGGRSFNGPDGKLMAYKFPTFPTYDEAEEFAKSKGFSPIEPRHA